MGMPFLVASNGGLKRDLTTRHAVALALFGLASAYVIPIQAVVGGGALSSVLSYVIAGTVAYAYIISLGEMIALLPILGGPIHLSQRFVDPAFALTLGWTWWFAWMLTFLSTMTYVGELVEFWTERFPGAWLAVAWVLVFSFNMLSVKIFGEAQFAIGMLRVVFAIVLIIIAIVINLGGAPRGEKIGFRGWKPPIYQFDDIPGAKGRFLYLWWIMAQALLSFSFSEITAMSAPEIRHPQITIPFVLKKVYPVFFVFYLVGIFVSTLLMFPFGVPSFNHAAENAGLRGLPTVITVTEIIVALASCTMCLYMATRGLHVMAWLGFAPKLLGKTSASGVPYAAVIFTSLFGSLAFMSLTVGGDEAFFQVLNTQSLALFFVWIGVLVTYLRFYSGAKVQGLNRAAFPFASTLQPYAAWYALMFSSVVALFHGFPVFLERLWETTTFVTSYLAIPTVLVIYAIAKLWFRTPFVRARDMDFNTGAEGFVGDEDGEALRMDDVEKR